MYIYIYILGKKLAYFFRKYYCSNKLSNCFENMIFSFGNIICSNEVNYLRRKYDLFVREYYFPPRKLNACFEHVIFSFENISPTKKS